MAWLSTHIALLPSFFVLLTFSLLCSTLRSRYHSVLRRINGPGPSSWILGSLLEFYGGGRDISVLWEQTWGKVVRFQGFLMSDRLQITDPVAIQHIFNAGPYIWERDTVEQPRFRIVFGKGLLSAKSVHHRRLRRVMMPAFNSVRVATLHPTFINTVKELASKWESAIMESESKSITINPNLDITFATLNGIGLAAFDYEFDAFNKGLEDPLLYAFAMLIAIVGERTYFQILLESLADCLPLWIVDHFFDIPLINGKSLRPQLKIMQQVSKKLFDAGLESANDIHGVDSRARKDLLFILLKANLAESQALNMSDEEVQDQLMTLIFAGWSAMSNTLTKTVVNLAAHPEAQDQLRREIRESVDQTDSESVLKAKYLDAVLTETTRIDHMNPLERVAAQDDFIPLETPIKLSDGSYVSGIPVSKGQLVSIPLVALNMDKTRFGADPNSFHPEQWLTDEGEKQRMYRGFGLPTWNGLMNFGSGPRACIGIRFALLQMKTYITALVSSFEFIPGKDAETIQVRLLSS